MDVFAALADPVRRALLLRLVARPARVVDLAAAHDISRPAISRHLRVLGEAGLVVVQNQGRERHYRLAPEGLAPVRRLVTELSADRPPISDTDLDALQMEVRRTVRERSRGEVSGRHTPGRWPGDRPQEDTG